jgi:hypothetical protein
VGLRAAGGDRHLVSEDFWALLIEEMIFSEKGRTAPFLRKNHPWILQPLEFHEALVGLELKVSFWSSMTLRLWLLLRIRISSTI